VDRDQKALHKQGRIELRVPWSMSSACCRDEHSAGQVKSVELFRVARNFWPRGRFCASINERCFNGSIASKEAEPSWIVRRACSSAGCRHRLSTSSQSCPSSIACLMVLSSLNETQRLCSASSRSVSFRSPEEQTGHAHGRYVKSLSLCVPLGII